MSDDVIWVVTEEERKAPFGTQSYEGSSNPFREPGFARVQRQSVPTTLLEQNMGEFLQRMGRVLTQAKQSASTLAGMTLDEIELSVEINGEGKVSLMGNGASLSTQGAITLRFKAIPVDHQ